jgi:hypothetical protein
MPSAPTVSLRYGWTPGLAAHVDVTSILDQVIAGNHQLGEIRASYRFDDVAEGAGLRVQFLDQRIWLDSDETPPSDVQRELIAHFSELTPEILVDDQGVVTGIPDIAGHRRRVLESFAATTPSLSEDQLSRTEQRLLNDDVVRLNAGRHWRGMVAAWIRADLVLGTRYATNKREPSPAFPGETQETQYVLSATKQVPCTRGGRALACVELEMRMHGDPAIVERLMVNGFHNVVPRRPGEAPASYPNPTLERIQRVITEPDGLIPHSYVYTEFNQGVLVFGGQTEPFRREMRSEHTFRYDDAPGGG